MAIPDDSDVTLPPRGQVDFLSSNALQWREEDLWLSWRSLTKQKKEISDGFRLENAAWRQWWKIRNKSTTVQPESLNW